MVPDACSTVTFPHQQCSGATKEPSLSRGNTRNLVLFRRGRQLGDGAKDTRVFWGLCHSRVTSATLCEGELHPGLFSEEGPGEGLSGA